ncbi:hypothetical protein [Megamonas sp.]
MSSITVSNTHNFILFNG